MQIINDPRIYTDDYPKSNIIIQQAINILSDNDTDATLIEILQKFLKNKNDAIINVALNLSPNLIVTQKIWQCLLIAINKPDMTEYAEIFTIPLVIVVGSKNQVRLPNEINTAKLNDLFYKNKIFIRDSDSFISGKLIEPSSIQAVTASQQYHLVRNISNSKSWLPLELAYNAIEVVNEGVFLRYLVGITIVKNGISGLDKVQFKQYSMDLMKLINQELATKGTTIFPIPFVPTVFSEALVVGNMKRTEIAIQVAFSNIVRKIREQGYTPLAYISTAPDSILLEVVAKEFNKLHELSSWHLSKVDDIEVIHQIIIDLLIDAQVEYEYK